MTGYAYSELGFWLTLSQNEASLLLSENSLCSQICNYSFKVIIKSFETLFLHREPDSFSKFQDFSDELTAIPMDVIIYCPVGKCKHLENLDNKIGYFNWIFFQLKIL